MSEGSGISALRLRNISGWRLDSEQPAHRYHSSDSKWHGHSVLPQIPRAARQAGSRVSEHRAAHGRLSDQGDTDAGQRKISRVYALYRETRTIPAARGLRLAIRSSL